MQGWEVGSPLMQALDVLPGGRRLSLDRQKMRAAGRTAGHSLDKHVGDKMSIFDNEKYTVGRHLQGHHGLRKSAAWWCSWPICSGSWVARGK